MIEQVDGENVRVRSDGGSCVTLHGRFARRLVDLYGYANAAEAAHTLVRHNIEQVATAREPEAVYDGLDVRMLASDEVLLPAALLQLDRPGGHIVFDPTDLEPER